MTSQTKKEWHLPSLTKHTRDSVDILTGTIGTEAKSTGSN